MTTETNPDAVGAAPPPEVALVEVDRTHLYTETRGAGAPVLLIGAADEDAELYRGIAERLAADCRVTTYDRRGTGRSGASAWPSDSGRHADDAAVLVEQLGLVGATVLGISAGGIVALGLALRHPTLVQMVLCFEPGVFTAVAGGEAFRLRCLAAVEAHLQDHPRDWAGAVDALGRAAVGSVDRSSLFAPPQGREWFARRTALHAESLIRGDLPLTGERFDTEQVAQCATGLRFAYGTASLPIFEAISRTLAGLRDDEPDALDGVGHGLYMQPDRAVDYISSHIGSA